MADRKTILDADHRRFAAHIRQPFTLIVMSLLAAMPIAFIASVVPRALVLPVFTLAALAVAATLALAAKMSGARWDGDAVTLWDAAGAFVLLGCAAAIFSQPENVSHWFGHSIVP